MGLILFTDKINSGKSEILNELSDKSTNYDGFIQFKKDNDRYIKYLDSKVIEKFSSNQNDLYESIKIGNFLFRKDIFSQLNTKIRSSTDRTSFKQFVIDEWGLLEMNGAGLNCGIDLLMNNKLYNKNNYLIIIRDWLFQNFIDRYNLNDNDFIKCNMQNIRNVLNNC